MPYPSQLWVLSILTMFAPHNTYRCSECSSLELCHGPALRDNARLLPVALSWTLAGPRRVHSPVLHNLCISSAGLQLPRSLWNPSVTGRTPAALGQGRESLCFPSWCSCLVCSFIFPPSFYQSVVAEIMEIQASLEPSPNSSRHIF